MDKWGFDRIQHEQVRADLRSGLVGLAQNRLPISSKIEDVMDDDVFDFTTNLPDEYYELGMNAIREGSIAVVSLAGGAGSRWTEAGRDEALEERIISEMSAIYNDCR